MNSKNTWLLLALAALLAGFIFAWEKFVAGPARIPLLVLPGLNPQGITSIQVRMSGQPELFADRTNGGWQLRKPLLYPGRSENVEALLTMLGGLPSDARTRFERLHARCLEMRGIAAGVRGTAGNQTGAAEEIRTPGLDRLLWLFLRLLLSKAALDRFLKTMNGQEISTRLEELRKNLAAAQTAADERVVRSLQDSIAMGELRLDNFGRAKKNAEFVSVELDRIEEKIQALAEMAVNRQDPDFLSSQVDSAAESMRQTEKAVSELQHLTGLGDQLEDPPAILETDLREVLRNDA